MKLDYYKVIRAIELTALLAGVVFFGTFLVSLMIEAFARNSL
jgi:hypothetical protein